MPLSHNEAADALRDIESAARRSFSAYGYRAAAPQVILWGVMWFAGYGGTYLIPRYTSDLIPQYTYSLWFFVTVFGSTASALIGMRAKRHGVEKFSWRIFFTWLAALGAIASVLAIFYPFSGKQIGSLFPLVAGWAYIVLGVWMGGRFVSAGLAIVSLTLFGFFYLLPNAFVLWMAFLGSAVLIGTGLWLRKA